jgi:VanZ family protein
MRTLLILFWVGAIFLFTCTSSFNGFIESGVFTFKWESHPRITELLSPLPANLSIDFLHQKIGHIIAFFILTLLLQLKFPSKLFVLLSAGTYSALTEVLQLYFTRGGRIFDIGFDLIGILIALALGSLFSTRQSRQIDL